MTVEAIRDGRICASGALLKLQMLTSLLILSTAARCDRKDTGESAERQHTVVAEQVNADYVALYALSKDEDEDGRYTTLLTGVDGKRWYREESAILDLGKIDRDSIMVVGRPDGRFEIVLPVKSALDQDRLLLWSRHHTGQPAGVVLDGKLVQVSNIPGELYGRVAVGAFATREEAEKELIIMKNGGFGDASTTRPGR